MELELEGQSVLITGSSQGIGKGIAEAFLKEQAHVILTGRQASKLDKTKKRFVTLSEHGYVGLGNVSG